MTVEHQIVVFQVGKKFMALPLERIEHILNINKNDETAISQSGDFIRFHREVIPWIPLWETFGETSIFSEIEALAEMLPQRRQEHIDWMNALEQSLLNGLPFTKARDPRLCAFGQWFYSFQTENQWLRALLSTIELPHARIHALADRLLELIAKGERSNALRIFEVEKAKTLGKVLLAFDTILAALPRLVRTLALIVNDGAVRYALGVDKVLDIHALGTDCVYENRGDLGTFPPRGFANATVSGNDLLLPVLDVEHFLRVKPANRC